MEPLPNPRSLTARILVCLLLVAALLWVAGRAAATEEAVPEVAYIHGGNIQRTGLENVTNDLRRDKRPALSPDGQTIAFVRRFESDRTESEIVRINVDGSGLQRLTNNYLLESWPTWSPDGTRLAFSAGDLYVMPVSAAGGGTPVRLTTGELNPWNIAWSPDGTRLAFNSAYCLDDLSCNNWNESELYVVRLAGAQLTRLTNNDVFDGNPTWSPDGARLAYQTWIPADSNFNINLIAAAGGPATPLVTAGQSIDPAWSPDGTLIAYTDGRYTITTVRPDGTDEHTFTGFGQRLNPIWTTDSRHLIYYAYEEFCGHVYCFIEQMLDRLSLDSNSSETLIGPNVVFPGNEGFNLNWTATDNRIAYSTDNFLYTVDISGDAPGPRSQLTFDTPVNGEPAWSPDGRRIAFSSQRSFDYNIHVVDAGGGNRRALTTHPGNDWNPSWSSDNQIAFTSNRDGNWELYVMNADGSGQRNLTHTPAVAENDAAWSPSGHRLAFARQEGGNWDVYVMNADGSGLTRLTNHAAADRNPTWSPNGARIAFESNRNGMDNIYILTVDGPTGNEVVWSRQADHEREPSWSADGTKLAFGVVSGYGNPQVESLMWAPVADSSSRHEIAASLSLHTQPAFRPVTYDVTPRAWVPVVRK